MKLYYSKGACSLAVRIIIHELNIKVEFESVNLKTKQTEKGGDYLKINPKGAVPVLELDDKQILTENAVIQQYLAEQNNNTDLLPAATNFKRYRVLEWLNYITTELHKGYGPLFNPDFSQEMKEKVVIPNLKKKFKFVADQLQQQTFLTGETFTLADAYLFVMLFWMKNFSIDMNEWPSLKRYFGELQKRKSIQQALKEEGFL